MPVKTEEQGGKIKPSGYEQEYTPEQLSELSICMSDPVYFIKKYVKTLHPTRGVVPFKLWDYQERMIRAFLTNDRVVAMCSRQVGKSTVTAAYLLWWCCFKDDQSVLVAAHKGRAAHEIMKRFKLMYEELPWWIKPGVKINNIYSMQFDNGSFIEGQTTTETTGRGLSISYLFLDEFAYVRPGIQSDFYTSILPTLSGGGRAIITSTPNTDEDKFAQIWHSAEEIAESSRWTDVSKSNMVINEPEENYETIWEDPEMAKVQENISSSVNANIGFSRVFVHWTEHPERDESFRIKMLREGLSNEEWLREYECSFISAEATLVNPSKLLQLGARARKPMLVDKHGGEWFSAVKPNVAHAVVLDPSEGTGGSNACIQVWNIPNMEQVAEWASYDSDQLEQTRMLYRMLRKVFIDQQEDPNHSGESDIYYTVESNLGSGVISTIENEGEERFPGWLVDSRGNKRRGLLTTNRSKKDFSLQLKKLIEQDRFIPRSKGLISELKDFVKTSASYSAKPGSRDDRVMTCVLMCHLMDEIKYYEDGLEERMHVQLIKQEEYADDEVVGVY